MLSNDKRALEQDTEGVEARLRTVEQNQLQLWQTLGRFLARPGLVYP
jgi:hypothetical protein